MHLETVAGGVRVWDLRPDGRAANAARPKVAKGRLAAWLITAPDADPGDVVTDADLGEGWSVAAEGDTVIATVDL